ncbi:unnamed protein product [Cylindrotheca closterium]|uniref:Uncharacterized protein n=1 Tax=Cylindrotheca closterium TaxID=2856 RepID=A0AAD2FGM0_9STRA|nr:unnamed protein product [Cylindrotheca closterium]
MELKENHSAMMKQDEAEEQQRLKKERNADAAAAAAFAKVEPMLKVSGIKTSSKSETAETPATTPAAVADV